MTVEDVPRPAPSSAWAGLLEALLVGVVAWVACMWWLAPVHGASAWNADDFIDYCDGVAHLRGDGAPWPLKRSMLPALVPSAVAGRWGIAAGLAVGASFGTVLVMASVYAWARLLAGRAAGALAVLAALALVPVSQTPRLLSFYPQVNGLLLAGAVVVTWGLLRGDLRGELAVIGGASLALCADVRGLAWALPWLAGGAAVAVHRAVKAPAGRAVPWPRRVAALSLALAVGWLAGRASFPEGTVPFEAQLDPRPIFHEMGSADPAHQPPFDTGGDFVWGRSSPHRLPDTVAFVVRTMGVRPPAGFPPAIARLSADAILDPLDLAWGVSVLVVLATLWRRPAHLAALVVAMAPYLVAWRGQHSVAQVYARFLQQLLPALAVLLGVGLVGITDIAARRLTTPARTAVRIGLVALAAMVTLGALPTPLSPWAAWRRPWPYVGQLGEADPTRDLGEGTTRDAQSCRAAIARDLEQGRWFPHRRP